MTQTYIGTKIVAAWPEAKDGEAGYAVRYEDGYQRWCPKETFENSYRPLRRPEADLVAQYGAEVESA